MSFLLEVANSDNVQEHPWSVPHATQKGKHDLALNTTLGHGEKAAGGCKTARSAPYSRIPYLRNIHVFGSE